MGKKKVFESQSAQLNQIAKDIYKTVGIGVVFLVAYTVANIMTSIINADQLETTMFLNQYRLGSKALTAAVQSYAVTGDEQYYNAYMRELNEDKNRDIAWAGLQKNDITKEEWQILESIANMSNGLVPLEEKAMQDVKNGDLVSAMDAVFGVEYQETIQAINDCTDDGINGIQARLAKKQSVMSVIVVVSQILFIIAFLYIVKNILYTIKFAKHDLLHPIIKVSNQLVELAQGKFDGHLDLEEDSSEVGQMVRSINFMKGNFTNMISEISEILHEMGQGNYNIQIRQEYVGEFTQIKESMLRIVEEMKHTLHTIMEVSKEIDSGSGQLAQAAQDLAEGSTIQANRMSEVADMIDMMVVNMENEAKEAQSAVSIAAQSGEMLMVGNAKMQELKSAIGEISNCSEAIRSIISAIEEIANQTNLLSLNASIEAARAGEAGRGFAVVAEQVKNLAEESTKAAGETTKLIEKTIDAVNKGISIADETVANMEQVMVGAKETTNKMEQMAQTLLHEVGNIRQIDSSVSQVSEIVDNNSAASEETAAVSEQQNAQVETMVSLMEQFKI